LFTRVRRLLVRRIGEREENGEARRERQRRHERRVEPPPPACEHGEPSGGCQGAEERHAEDGPTTIDLLYGQIRFARQADLVRQGEEMGQPRRGRHCDQQKSDEAQRVRTHHE
jgi:hypothetical protein